MQDPVIVEGAVHMCGRQHNTTLMGKMGRTSLQKRIMAPREQGYVTGCV